LDDGNRPKFDPRSPVQPGRNPAPYFVAALAAAVLVWGAQQYWPSGSKPEGSQEVGKAGQIGFSEPRTARGDLRTLFSADDYPASAAANNEQGTVQAQLTVDTSGGVSRCTIIRSSGHATLDEATCDILRKRARFTPARNMEGIAVESTVVTPPVKWQLEG
jgi:TonB family protein